MSFQAHNRICCGLKLFVHCTFFPFAGDVVSSQDQYNENKKPQTPSDDLFPLLSIEITLWGTHKNIYWASIEKRLLLCHYYDSHALPLWTMRDILLKMFWGTGNFCKVINREMKNTEYMRVYFFRSRPLMLKSIFFWKFEK